MGPAMGPPVTESGVQGTSRLAPDSPFWPVSTPATSLSLAWRWDPLPVDQSLTEGVSGTSYHCPGLTSRSAFLRVISSPSFLNMGWGVSWPH